MNRLLAAIILMSLVGCADYETPVTFYTDGVTRTTFHGDHATPRCTIELDHTVEYYGYTGRGCDLTMVRDFGHCLTVIGDEILWSSLSPSGQCEEGIKIKVERQ